MTTTVRCSFCGRDKEQVERLIAGPGSYICDRCVRLCDMILAGEGITSFPTPADQNDEALLATTVALNASRRQVDDALATYVRELRGRGVTWAQLGEALGISRQSAWERFTSA